MIHSKSLRNKSTRGFTLIESVIALMIVGLIVGSLFKLQTSLFRGTYFSHGLIEKFIKIKNIFVQAEQEKWYKKEKTKKIKDENSQTTLTYNLKNISDKSPLKSLKNLYIETVDIEWLEGSRKRSDSLFLFKFIDEKI